MARSRTTPDPISLNMLPQSWREWHIHICELLDIQPDMSLASRPLPKIWFLIPNQSELTEDQADNLISSVRDYLYGQGHTVKDIRNTLSALQPDASLLFLYAMRYIAFREAGKHYYWPAFRQIMFEDRLSYEDVALGLAATTSTLWLRLYEATNGVLYFPREGSRHIKWPLAHAGLTGNDKEVLKAMAISLLASDTAQYENVFSMEVDEFILFFHDWLQYNPEYRETRFGRLIESHRDEREIITELGHQWLMFHQDEIEEHYEKKALYGKSIIPVKRRLSYDPRTNQLALKLIVGRLKGQHQVSFYWGENTILVPDQYQQSADETIPIEQSLSILRPEWPAQATLIIDSDSYELSIPTLEKNKGVVFDPYSGLQTKLWELGTEYYVLLPGKRLKADVADRVFQNWTILGEPNGEWMEYSLLWVRTRDPLTGSESSLGKSDTITTILGELEQASEEMGLPSFGHQYRVRATLIGGEFAGSHEDGVPVFSPSRPPYLELRGVWDKDIEVVLSRLDEASGQYIVLDDLVVISDLAGTDCIIEIWEHQAPHGRYRIEIENGSLDFIVRSATTTEIRASVAKTEIKACFKDDEGNPIVTLNRYALDEFTLYVTAWPHADLLLEVYSSNTQSVYTLSLLLDEYGQWTQRVSELPMNFSSFPPGHVYFEVSWRGVFHCRLTVLDKSYVSARNVELVFDKVGGEDVLNCRGVLEGASDYQEYLGILLSEIPWKMPLEAFEMDIDPDGNFVGRVYLDWMPTWLVIGSQGFNQEDAIEPVAVCQIGRQMGQISANATYALDELTTEHPKVWASLANNISRISHPPALGFYLQVEPLLTLISKTDSLKKLRASWRVFQFWEELESAKSLMERGFSAALFRSSRKEGVFAQSVDGVQIDFSGLKEGFEQLSFHYPDDPLREGGRIVKAEVHGDLRLKLYPDDSLCGCSKCGVIVPFRRFPNHIAPYREFEDCTGIGPSFTEFHAGRQSAEFISIGVLLEPSREVFAIQDQLKPLLKTGTVVSPEYHPLLNELSSLVPPETDRHQWLEELLYALEQYCIIHSTEYLQVTDLLKTAKAIEKYQDALIVILAFAQNRMQ